MQFPVVHTDPAKLEYKIAQFGRKIVLADRSILHAQQNAIQATYFVSALFARHVVTAFILFNICFATRTFFRVTKQPDISQVRRFVFARRCRFRQLYKPRSPYFPVVAVKRLVWFSTASKAEEVSFPAIYNVARLNGVFM